ncbi:hypothetical protein FXO38_26944 [Capsicum annuum]|nr:hypothetical protein FXO38_26944 [Capsicum annuum]KAF3642640.1 hypothetical protein FXO37_22416 [Capsicum annuum]
MITLIYNIYILLIVLWVVEELDRPCRERTADFIQWLHCLAVISLLLEHAQSFRWMHGKAIEPTEILHSVLLPGGPSSITVMASKALIDLGLWNGPNVVDKAMNQDLSSQLQDHKINLSDIKFSIGRNFWLAMQKCLSKAFMPVMRSLWPGINGNATGSTYVASNMRKSAIQASRFMSGEEGLAIRIAAEVVSFPAKKTAAEKAYVSALCKTLFLLHFRPTDQGAVKLMRQLLSRVTVLAEKELLKGVETDG